MAGEGLPPVRRIFVVLVLGSRLADVAAERNLAVHDEGNQASGNAVIAVDARGHQIRAAHGQVQREESNSSENSSRKVATAEANVCCWSWDSAQDKLLGHPRGRHLNALVECDLVTDGPCDEAKQPKLKSLFNAEEVLQAKLREADKVQKDGVKAAEKVYKQAKKIAEQEHKATVAKAAQGKKSALADAKIVYDSALVAADDGEVAQKQKAEKYYEDVERDAAADKELREKKAEHWYKEEEAAVHKVMGLDSQEDSYKDLLAKRQTCGWKQWCCCRYQGISQLVPVEFDLTACSTVAASPLWTGCNYFDRCQKCETPLCGEHQACHDEPANTSSEPAKAANDTPAKAELAKRDSEPTKADTESAKEDNETAQAGLVEIALKGSEVGSEGGVSGESTVCCWKWNAEADKLHGDEHGRHSNGLTKCDFVTDGACTKAQGEPQLKSLFNAKDVLQGKLQAKAAQQEERVKMAVQAFKTTMKSAKESRKKAIAEASQRKASDKSDAKTSYNEAITAAKEAEAAEKQNAQVSYETAVKQAEEVLEVAKRKEEEEFKQKETEIRTEMGYESKEDSYDQDLDAKRKECGNKWCCCRYEGFSQLVPAKFDLTKCSAVAASTFWTRCNYFERCQKCETPLCGKNQACKD